MPRKILYIITAIIIIMVLGIAWHYYQGSNVLGRGLGQPVIAVNVANVKSMAVPNTVLAVGTLKAKQQINVASQIAGKITKINYQPGAFIKKGTLLIQLDDRIYVAQLQSALSALHLAKINYQRYQQLAKLGAQSKQQLDQMRANYQQAQAAVKTNKTNLSDMHITAPFDGYVGPKIFSVGDYVQKGQSLTTLTNRSILQVNYSLPEQYLTHIKLGQVVTINLSGDKHHDFKGTVSYISPTVDESTHSVALQANIPNPKNILAPGLFVKVKQILGINNHALVIPEQSVVPTISGAVVYVVDGHKVKSVSVKTGLSFKGMVEIKKGLKANQEIVTQGQQLLQNGSKIKVEK